MAVLTQAQLANLRSMRENDVETAICDFLRYRGWRVQRNQSGLFQRPGSKARIRIGEKGMFDWEAIRSVGGVDVEFFYLETKRPGKKLSGDQEAWAATIRSQGVMAIEADSLESFRDWYDNVFPDDDKRRRR